MSKLFDDSGSESDVDLKTNNNYANTYNNWRQKEELNKLKTKYGEEALQIEDRNSSSSSDSEDESEDVPEDVENEFLKTLSSLKNKDPKIYDENFEFFKNVVNKTKQLQTKEVPMYIKDYEREMIIQREGRMCESDEEKDLPLASPTYVDEQNKLKENLKNALKNVKENDDDEWGGMFKARQKSKVERKKEEVDYKEWLVGNKKEIADKNMESDLKPLKDYWSDPNLGDGEKFLRDYVLNRRFSENEDENHIPTYEEIVHDSDDGLSEDEEAIEKQEEFEHKYNYRFEEPDQEFIKRYPRLMEHSVRRQDDRRKIKRVETKERKQEEKKQKMAEIKQMQILKRKEIEEKILKLKEITGNTDVQFSNEDIENDFDPDAHDERMQKLFNDEFYEGVEEEQKPEFPDLDDELELESYENFEPHCEDENFNMDCDYDPTASSSQTVESTKEKRQKRRKSKFATAVGTSKPVFDPNDKTYQEYLDEYYKLDCEDIVADIPCRFKYRKVIPNDFGLSVEEILLAKDKELNKWCSIKKAVQYRPENIEKYDVIAFGRKAQNDALKRKVLPSIYAEQETVKNEEPVEVKENETTSKQKKKRKKEKVSSSTSQEENKKKTKNTVPDNLLVDDLKDSKEKHKKVSEKKSNSVQEANGNEISKPAQKVKRKHDLKDSKEKLNLKRSKVSEEKPEIPNVKHKIRKMKKINAENSVPEAISKPAQKVKRKRAGKQNPTRTEQNVKNKKFEFEENNPIKISDARLTAYGFKPKKFKNKMKYGSK